MNCTGECLKCGKCSGFEILNTFVGQSEVKPRPGFGIAIDIGTTSVVLALLNLSSGEIIARHSFMNPQRLYGPDVISRIDAANKGKLSELRDLIIDAISTGIETLLTNKQIEVEKPAEIVIAGNTVMTHLLLGLSCETLGKFPFKSDFQLEEKYELFEYPVRLTPWLAAFVGGDILAGLLSVLPRKDKRFLLIDLGTNGELALYNEGRLTVTATAAGPAFEGSGYNNEASLRMGASAVIGNLAELVRTGVIDETGLLSENVDKGTVFLSQKEIRDLQLAKSAVRSGLEILLDSADLIYNDLDTVYLAGGIGQAINIDSAITIGLLPKEIKEKVIPIGNASLGGAVRLLLAPDKTSVDMNKLLANFTEINLAEHPKFNDLFMKHLALSLQFP